jgi:hypothetical protein
MKRAPDQEESRRQYLLHELRRLWVEYEEAQDDIKAVADTLAAKVITVDEAAGILWGANILQLLGLEPFVRHILPEPLPAEWRQSAHEYHEARARPERAA